MLHSMLKATGEIVTPQFVILTLQLGLGISIGVRDILGPLFPIPGTSY